MGGFGVKFQHFPLTLLVVLTTLTLPCERDNNNNNDSVVFVLFWLQKPVRRYIVSP